jgi:hypothetical protein
MRKATRLTLGILKSLYPNVDLYVAGVGFAATCSDEEVGDLVRSFVETVTQGLRDDHYQHVLGLRVDYATCDSFVIP